MSPPVLLTLCLLVQPGEPAGPDPLEAKVRPHWSFRPVERGPPPEVRDMRWPRMPVDRFILARLEAAGLAPSPEASRGELIRRVTFDLTGLPPAPGEVESFIQDDSPGAYERLVDCLLDSPRYGERWARHWLDVVRFAESEGFEYDNEVAGAWRYRDYVIRAFNDDKPYDRFVEEQIAGDEMNPECEESRIAAGFHRLGAVRRNAGNQEVAGSRNEVLTERTDAIGSAFLGLTIGCARCHDHKFDPIPQKDYYRLQAFLAATQDHDISLVTKEEEDAWKSASKQPREEVKKLESKLERADAEMRERLQKELEQAEARVPPPPPVIAAVQDSEPDRTPIHVLLRGDWDKKGEPVGMRFPSALEREDAPELPPGTPRPRMLLARWITNPGNPLAARVMVNRIWAHHFGRGLVATPNDFGSNGASPTHPRLLDHLAGELVDGRWSIKRLHRLILLSSTYRQSSHPPGSSDGWTKDPENRLLGRFSRRRLEAEEIRDAMLAVSGKLVEKTGGRSVLLRVDENLVKLLYKPSQWTVSADASAHHRRSIYLFAKRNLPLPFLEAFDQPALQTSAPVRVSSTHVPQALELLNGAIATELAAAFAERLEREAGPSRARQVDLAYRLVAGRPADPKEEKLALDFLETQPLTELAIAMLNLNAFLYVN